MSHWNEFEAHEKVRLFEDGDEILPGLRCFLTGAHHRSSMVFLIETAMVTVAVTDCSFKYANVEKMIPLGIYESLEEFYAAANRIKREASTLIPLYEPDLLERHRHGRIA